MQQNKLKNKNGGDLLIDDDKKLSNDTKLLENQNEQFVIVLQIWSLNNQNLFQRN